MLSTMKWFNLHGMFKWLVSVRYFDFPSIFFIVFISFFLAFWVRRCFKLSKTDVVFEINFFQKFTFSSLLKKICVPWLDAPKQDYRNQGFLPKDIGSSPFQVVMEQVPLIHIILALTIWNWVPWFLQRWHCRPVGLRNNRYDSWMIKFWLYLLRSQSRPIWHSRWKSYWAFCRVD